MQRSEHGLDVKSIDVRVELFEKFDVDGHRDSPRPRGRAARVLDEHRRDPAACPARL